MKLNPYLVMPGTSREALEFYSKALNGKVLEMNEFGDMLGVPEEAKKLIIHGTLEFNENIIMFSDAMPNQEVVVGDNVTLSVNVNTVAESQHLYKALKEKIEVQYLDREFKKQKQVFTGFTAQIIQHEVDHFEGIII